MLKTVFPRVLYNNHELKDNKTLSIDVSEYERGNYVLYVINGDQTERRQIQLK